MKFSLRILLTAAMSNRARLRPIGQLVLNRSKLGNQLAELFAALTVHDGFVKCDLCDPNRASGDGDSTAVYRLRRLDEFVRFSYIFTFRSVLARARSVALARIYSGSRTAKRTMRHATAARTGNSSLKKP